MRHIQSQANKYVGSRMRACWASECAAICVLLVSGCGHGPMENMESARPVLLKDGNGAVNVYPAVNVGLIASTEWHLLQDPDVMPYTRFRLHGLQILTGPSAEFVRAPYQPGVGAFGIVRQERSSNVVLAPGFNPVFVGDGGFWSQYRRIQQGNTQIDADYLSAERSAQPYKYDAQDRLIISMIPVRREGTGPSIQVNHSMLVFLLGLNNVWEDVRRAQKKAEAVEAIKLICRTVADMAQAHRKKWPDYQWSNQQRKIIDWCETVAWGKCRDGAGK